MPRLPGLGEGSGGPTGGCQRGPARIAVTAGGCSAALSLRRGCASPGRGAMSRACALVTMLLDTHVFGDHLRDARRSQEAGGAAGRRGGGPPGAVGRRAQPGSRQPARRGRVLACGCRCSRDSRRTGSGRAGLTAPRLSGPAQGAPSQYSGYQQGQGQQYGSYRASQTGPSAQQQRPYGYEQARLLGVPSALRRGFSVVTRSEGGTSWLLGSLPASVL